LGQSGRKKTPPRKAEKKTRALGNYQIDYLTTKIQKPISVLNVNHNLSDIEKINENLNLSLHEEPFIEDKDQIEFSSKNVMSHSGLFSLNFSKLKESQSIMDSFLSKTRERDSNTTTPNINNIHPLQDKSPSNKQSSYVLEENEKLQKEILEYKKIILEKDKEIEKFKSKILDHDESIKNISLINKTLDSQLQTFKISFIKFMKEFEEVKRTNKKKWLNEQEYRLGKAVLQRVGQTTIDVWEEGEEILKINVRVKEIEREKLELENQKGNLSSYLKKRGNTVETNENQDELNSLKELISFKLGSLQKEELKIRETFEKLQIEKTLMILERKRIKEEESSRFGSSQSKEKFPILSNRYLILSLLGKGGYSEVYKAYDLENNIEVACKIHQLNPQWSDSIKENYIRHTIRENQIHKEINHSKIVKHYDTIEIDNNSFCTVLELCSGPDLHTYLKMYKSLPEKEAKGIVNQILSGLQYMNKLQRKIIHYDLKPQNIIFHNMEVKISDFGLAKIMENNSDRLELTSQGVGTYWYLPPECFDTSRNPPGISSKVDIWSLGVILYELIFGARPFGQNCTQDKILKEGIILNAKQVAFPAKPIISKPCKVRKYKIDNF
jgi:tousled-like kinase